MSDYTNLLVHDYAGHPFQIALSRELAIHQLLRPTTQQPHAFIMKAKHIIDSDPKTKKGDLIVMIGADGFIGDNLTLYFPKKGYKRI